MFALVSRLDTQPRVTGLWLSADTLERRSNQLAVHYRGYFAGVPLESVQRVTLQPPHRVEFHQTRGGLRSLQGDYTLQPADGETELTMTVEADIGIPLITDAAAARVLRSYVERTLDKIKLTAERELPRVVRRREEPAAPSVTTEIEPAPLPVGDQDAVDEVVEPTEVAVPEESPPPPAPAISETSRPAGTKRRRRRRRRRRPQSPPASPST